MPTGVYQSPNRRGGVKGKSGVYSKTDEHKQKIRDTLLKKGIKPPVLWGNKNMLGKIHSQEIKRKIGLRTKEKIQRGESWHKIHKVRFGENSPNWKGGKSKREIHSLNNIKYKEWRLMIFARDNFKCRIENIDCKGKIEAHHILRWAEYLELRYEVNNGITLCHFHHPRKIKDEMKLLPIFQELVKN